GKHPSEYAIVAAQAILHPEVVPIIHGRFVRRTAYLEVVRVKALHPPFTERLILIESSEVEPSPVGVKAHAIHAGHPYEHGSTVGRDPKTLFTLPERLHGPFALQDVIENLTEHMESRCQVHGPDLLRR